MICPLCNNELEIMRSVTYSKCYNAKHSSEITHVTGIFYIKKFTDLNTFLLTNDNNFRFKIYGNTGCILNTIIPEFQFHEGNKVFSRLEKIYAFI